MSFYEEKIRNLKANVHEILKLEYLGKSTSLQIVDNSDETITLLTKWRNKHWDGFNTKFHATFDTTQIWLDKIIKDKNQILFLLVHDNKKIGNLGIALYDEKDDCIWMENFIKAESNIAPGIMEYVEKFFLKWIFDEFNNSKIKFYVFSDNYKTIKLHEKCGFLTLDSIPLKREFSKDGWKWIPTDLSSDEEYGERYFLIMGQEKNDKRYLF